MNPSEKWCIPQKCGTKVVSKTGHWGGVVVGVAADQRGWTQIQEGAETPLKPTPGLSGPPVPSKGPERPVQTQT